MNEGRNLYTVAQFDTMCNKWHTLYTECHEWHKAGQKNTLVTRRASR